VKGLLDTVNSKFLMDLDEREWMKKVEDAGARFDREDLREALLKEILAVYEEKEKEIGEAVMRHLEKMVMLQVVDNLWKDHLLNMDYLKEGIGLRGYGQKNPLNEYKREGFEMFMAMMEKIREEVIEYLFKIRIEGDHLEVSERRPVRARLVEHRGQQAEEIGGQRTEPAAPVRREGKKVGRNEPCPCGSGKKYKKCCGA
jgi:preprotein translocase subunit SecA